MIKMKERGGEKGRKMEKNGWGIFKMMQKWKLKAKIGRI